MSTSFCPVVWMGSLETPCLAQGITVGPVPALVTPAQIISMLTHAMLTTPLTRSSVTADKATPVSYHTTEIYSGVFLYLLYIWHSSIGQLTFSLVSCQPYSFSLLGSRCDLCAPGYYGNPEQAGGQCLPCECNGNIDTEDPESCDPRTGQCLKCLYHTDGLSCAHCQLGYYGNALAHDCRRKYRWQIKVLLKKGVHHIQRLTLKRK